MFFLLSKILDFIVSPTSWIVIAALLYLFVKNARVKKYSLYTLLSVVLIFTNPFLINQCMHSWELKGETYKNINHPYDAAVVLGGYMKYYNSELDAISFGDASDRLMEGLMLYRKGIAKKIILSGGNGKIVEDRSEAVLAKEFLATYCQVPGTDIYLDTISKNTVQNIVETRKILQREKFKNVLLITSAFHMRRSLAICKKHDVIVTPYCTDQYSGSQSYYPTDLLIPDTECLFRWDILLHEWIGYITYKLMGYL